jgi:hypothetical protein
MADVFKVRHTMSRCGTHGHYISDLIFENGMPKAVIEWADTPQGSAPAVTVDLDPQFLCEVPGDRYQYVYENEIADPRRFD